MNARHHAAFTSDDHSALDHDNLPINHAGLEGVTADQHHARDHTITGATHTASGLTAGHVLRATGATTFAIDGGPLLLANGTEGAPTYSFAGAPGDGFFSIGAGALGVTLIGTERVRFSGSRFLLASGNEISWTDGTAGGNPDLSLFRDGPNTFAQRNGSSSQTWHIYNTYTAGGTNYERGVIGWSGNVFTLQTNAAGSGVARSMRVGPVGASTILTLQSAGTDRWIVNAQGHWVAATDNTYDIGASSAARPRVGYFAQDLYAREGGASEVAIGAFSGEAAVRFKADNSKLLYAASSDGLLTATMGFRPSSNNALDLGTASIAWRNIFAGTKVASPSYENAGAGLSVGTTTAHNLDLLTNGVVRWGVVATGHLQTLADNAYDVGGAGANRPRTINVGTSVVLTNTTLADGSITMAGANSFTINAGGSARFRVLDTGSIILATAALATNATGGFVYIPTMAGAPTGTFVAQTGTLPFVYDSTGHRLNVGVSGSTYRRVGLQAPATYTVTNLTTDRTFDADNVTLNELADVVGTLISDLGWS